MKLFSRMDRWNGSSRTGARKKKIRRFCTNELCESLESRILLSGLAPANILGDSITLYTTAGSGNLAPPSATRVVAASSGTNMAATDLIAASALPSGTYTYVVNSNPNDAKLVFTNSDAVYTVQLAFSTTGTGTYTLMDSGGSASGVFNCLASPVPLWAPTALSDDYFTFGISGAGGSNAWASSGSYYVLAAASGDGYTLAPISGSTTGSSGEYVWDKTANAGGGFEYEDTTNSTAGVIHLSFTSANAGIFYNTDATSVSDLSDFQWGTFTLQTYTTTALSSTLNPAALGDSVTIKATVSPNTGNGNTATGNVTFKDGTTTLGSVAINGSGVASYTTSAFTLGTHAITATYAGDSNFTGSAAPVALDEVVTLQATTTVVSSTLNPAVVGASVTLQAAINPHINNSIVATGMVTFMDGGTSLGTGSLNSSGLATYTTSTLALGTHGITAIYAGDSYYAGSTSTVVFDQFIVNSHSTNLAYVTQLYNDLLGRAPDSGGLNYWTGLLDAGTTIQTVAAGIANSNESNSNVVSSLYEDILGRAPDSGGLAYWTGQLDAGATVNSIRNGFFASNEYYANQGGTDADWINAVYQYYLGRAPDSGGLSYWEGVLSAGGASASDINPTRLSAANYIGASPEYYNDVVSNAYEKYLLRAVDSGALSYYSNALFTNALTVNQFIVDLVTSPEYFTAHDLGQANAAWRAGVEFFGQEPTCFYNEPEMTCPFAEGKDHGGNSCGNAGKGTNRPEFGGISERS